jgi:hypothetical protein
MDNPMMDDVGFVSWFFKTITAIVLAIGGFFMRGLSMKIDKQEQDLHDHKLHVSDHYVKASDAKDSFNRVHNRLDDIANDLKTLIKEARK